MRLIFLDIDGVLNDHSQLPSGYCGIRRESVEHLNHILDSVPDAKIMISSAWRYMILRGDMTVKGFEYLLLVHGVKCRNRIEGHTGADGSIEDEPNHFDVDAWKIAGLRWRADQIVEEVCYWEPKAYAVIDDLPLSVPNLVQTDGKIGLTREHADRVIELLTTPTNEEGM